MQIVYSATCKNKIQGIRVRNRYSQENISPNSLSTVSHPVVVVVQRSGLGGPRVHE